jgi:hypothetical protein
MRVLTTQAQLRKAKHVEGLEFRCAMCGEVKPVQTNGGTGYGYGFEGKLKDKPVCYECCGKLDRERMEHDGVATMYLTKRDGRWFVTNWPGTLAFPAGVQVGRHNMAGKRYDAWFTMGGFQWHGVTYGDNTQICHCKRTKERLAA